MWYIYSDTNYGGTHVLLKEGHIHMNEKTPSLKLLINEQLKSVHKFGMIFCTQLYTCILLLANIEFVFSLQVIKM